MKFTVNSLLEFLELIERQNIKDMIFRGQNEPYHGIRAGGFRPYKGGWESDKLYDFNLMIKEYKHKVIKQLSIDEKEHFLAYAQHYGIPTNLIDFSYSPLVALFFACENKREVSFTLSELLKDKDLTSVQDTDLNKEIVSRILTKAHLSKPNKAEVYLINKKRLIDASEIILKFGNKNLFELIVENQEVQKWFYESIIPLFQSVEKSVSYIINLVKTYESNKIGIDSKDSYPYFNEEIEMKNESFNKYFESLKKDCHDDLIKMYKLMVSNRELKLINVWDELIISELFISHEDKNVIAAKLYILLLINMICVIKDYSEMVVFELDFYFKYQPPLLFDRISNQKALFIIQPYIYERESAYNFGVFSYQNILPDYTIEINNHEKIIEELDFLGINRETIFGDLDNIARVVKSQHDKTFK